MSPESRSRSTRRAIRYATLAGGWALLVAGFLMLFLPGPGLAAILGGLALLGREAPWARRLDHRIRARLRLCRSQGPRGPAASHATPVPSAPPGAK
ncbi:MAG: PGPGW domain-containing protein [Anaeromyxobacteraceae bacterium]